MSYNWQQEDWPHFQYDSSSVEGRLFAFAELFGQMSGIIHSMPANLELEAMIQTMVTEAIKTSEIEGELLNRQDVVSSIRNQLGLNEIPLTVRDKRSGGAGELMTDVRKTYAEPLTEEKLFHWHRLLMTGNTRIRAGAWRKHHEPMQVISGAVGKEQVHFEAPPSAQVPREMKRFIQWFNDTAPGGRREIKKALIRSAIAHLYFESIHPFEDGNGRIGRAISEKALSQTLGRPVLLSLSRTIEADRKAYYTALSKAQRTNRITPRLEYFVDTIVRAQEDAGDFVRFILKKSKFFDQYKDVLNERQLKVVRKMFDAGPTGFAGGMNATKYISITRTSKSTATRDLQSLVALGIFIPDGGGRSTRYRLDIGH